MHPWIVQLTNFIFGNPTIDRKASKSTKSFSLIWSATSINKQLSVFQHRDKSEKRENIIWPNFIFAFVPFYTDRLLPLFWGIYSLNTSNLFTFLWYSPFVYILFFCPFFYASFFSTVVWLLNSGSQCMQNVQIAHAERNGWKLCLMKRNETRMREKWV